MDKAEKKFHSWIAKAVPSKNLDGVIAYQFNIAETSEEFLVEVVGSDWYDPKDSDWACEETWTCRPLQYPLPYSEHGREWEPMLGFVAGAVRSFVTGDPAARSLRDAQAVTVGFVDGELVRVWPHG